MDTLHQSNIAEVTLVRDDRDHYHQHFEKSLGAFEADNDAVTCKLDVIAKPVGRLAPALFKSNL